MTETQVAAVETQVAAEAVVTETVVEVAATPNAPRAKRFSFGPVWNRAVVDGKAKNFDKLVEQAVRLHVGARSDMKRLKLVTLRSKVAAKLQAQTVAVVEEAATTETVAA